MKRGTTTLLAAILATTLATALTSCGHNQPAQITAFTSTPGTITSGASAKLSWTDTGTPPLTLTLDHGIGDVSGKTNTTVKPTTTTTYTLTASNTTGKATKTTTVTVQAGGGTTATAPTITTFAATPATVNAGSSTTLSWSIAGTTPMTLSIDHGIGNVSGHAATSVMPSQTTSYTLTATNAAGSDTATVTVTVVHPPTIASFTANPSTLTAGAASTLSWSVTGAGPISLSIDQGLGNVTGKSSVGVRPSQTTTYTLTAANRAGSTTAQTTITVNAASPTDVTVTQQGPLLWLAVQDGATAWKALSGTTLPVWDALHRYGVAWACTVPTGSGTTETRVRVLQATTADATAVTASCPAVPTTDTVNVKITGLPGGSGSVLASMAGASQYASGGAPFTLYFGHVPDGQHLAYAIGYDLLGTAQTIHTTTLDVTGPTTWTVDASTGTSPTTHLLAYSNAPSGWNVTYGANVAPLGDSLGSASAGSQMSYVLLPSGLPSGSLYQLGANAMASSGSPPTPAGFVEADHWTATSPSSYNLALPAPMGSGADFTVDSSGHGTASWGPVSLGGSGPTLQLVRLTGGSGGAPWTALVTPAWFSGPRSYTLPDFTSTPGWNTGWAWPSGTWAYVTLAVGEAPVPTLQDLVTTLIPWDIFDMGAFASPPTGTTLELAGTTFRGTH